MQILHSNNVHQSTTININHHYLLHCITWICLVDILIKFTTTDDKTYSIFFMNSLGNVTYVRLIHKTHFHLFLQIIIVHYPLYIHYIFHPLNYNCTYAWRKNLIGHNIKFPTTSPIFRVGESSIFTFLKGTYSSSLFLCTSTDTFCKLELHASFSLSCLSAFGVRSIFFPHLLHNPLFPQHSLPSMWKAVVVLQSLWQPALANKTCIKNSRMHYARIRLISQSNIRGQYLVKIFIFFMAPPFCFRRPSPTSTFFPLPTFLFGPLCCVVQS